MDREAGGAPDFPGDLQNQTHNRTDDVTRRSPPSAGSGDGPMAVAVLAYSHDHISAWRLR